MGTQVTYDQKSETMKVTACNVKAPAYGHAGYGTGDHQVCREEYQTQAYQVPIVTVPLEITEVRCEDKIENKCFNVAKFADATNTVEQKEIVIGEPSCEQITLTLPTQACAKAHAHVYQAAPAYHG